MNTAEFLASLNDLDVKIWIEDNQLRYRAPKGVITSALKQEVMERKAEILCFLKEAKTAKNFASEPILAVKRDDDLPLSFHQQSLWFLHQLDRQSHSYNESLNLRIIGVLDVAALEQSINQIVRRHEVLRTIFPTVDGFAVQRILPSLTVSIPLVDLQGLEAAEVQLVVTKEIRQPFDLEKAPLMRATLLRLSSESHLLILTIHHIIVDGWSMGVFIEELSICYQAFSTGSPTPSPELTIQYGDFAVWQRQWLTEDLQERQLDYWKQQLAGAMPFLELPTDYPRPSVQTFSGAIREFKLNSNLTAQLRALSQETGTTLFVVLLSAFAVLLHRYSGQDDICIGSPFASRSRTELEPLIGLFVNSLVLRTQIKENPSFSEFLTQVHQVTLNAHAYQGVPFEQVVEALNPERSPSYNPLFQVMFALENFSLDALELPGITLTPELVERGAAQFDLSLSMWETKTGLTGLWEYSSDLFDEATIARMAGHFQTLLEEIVVNSQRLVKELPLLLEAERQQLLLWNNTKTDYPKDLCIHQLFEAQAAQQPEAIALVLEDQRLTYRELNYRANQLAYYLQNLGVQADTLVGICVERSIEMIVGILGILKAGGAYVPLDPAYPQERLAFMLEDANVSVLLTQKHLVKQLPQHAAQVVLLDSNWQEISRNYDKQPITSVKPNNLAYVIYTSGSTGTPKGVLIEHRSLVNYTCAVNAEYGVTRSDRVLQFTSLSVDVSGVEIYTCLTTGATLVLRTDSMVESIQTFLQKCQKWEITVAILPTAYWHEIVARLKADELVVPPTLRLVVIGGEQVIAARLKDWHRSVGAKVKLINAYGPTEATIEAITSTLTCDLSDSNPQHLRREVPIGRPIANTQVYILDRHLQLVPIGVPGELHIGGDGLARGYLNRPDLTQAKFIPNPFSNESGSRLYKTGDSACYLSDGNIEFIGRIDDQVKIRGFRIELGEIEFVISQHPSVKQTVVITSENIAGNKQLVAYIVPQSAAPSSNDLRDFLKQTLPNHMIPATFIMLETLPLSPNGKIDRKALPKPETAYQPFAAIQAPPQTLTQKILATIWAEVLQLQQVGIYDNFFELGGDSILSIQIIARCHQANLQLTPKDLFQHQTIAELAQIITPTSGISVEQGVVTGIVPLTPIQHWFVEQNLPEPHHFNQSFLFEVSPDLKPELLQQVFQQLLLQHDTLRLRLIPNGSTWQLLNASTEDSEIFSIVELSQIASTEQSAAIETTANQLQASLSLSSGPVIRVALFDLGNHQPNRLLIIIHHLAVDGVSWRILLEDLVTAYQQLNRGETIQLPAKTTSFRDWAVKLTEYAQSQIATAELDYWLTQFETHIPPLPVDYPTEIAENQLVHATEVSISLSAEQTSALLKEVPSAYNTQINDVLLTALVQSFAHWTGQTSLLIDLEGHGREELFADVNLSRTVGWFTSVFPILLKLEQSESPGKSLKSIKEQLRQIPKRGVGYGIIRYLSEDETPRHKLQCLPQAQVSFNYLGQFDQMLSAFPILGLAQETSGSSVSLKGKRSHLLEINGFVADGKLQFSWVHNTKLHQRATIERLANGFIESLATIISHCLSPEAGGYTPSDFPDAKLTQAGLDELVESLTSDTQIESIYPLSPMQQGMLFHTLYAPNSGVYFEQLVLTLSGNLNVSAFEQAWRRVVEVHPILRTFFVWKNRQHPFQVACKSVNLPWNVYDWRSLEDVEQEERLAAFLQAEREGGFKLDEAPLMCCTILRMADDNYQFVWSHHHLLMDGWCLPIVLKQVWSFYEAFNRGENLYLDAPPPYRNYIAWLQQQDSEAAEKFWRSTLAGFTAPTPLVVDKLVENLSYQQGVYDEQDIKLSASLTDALKEFARQNHLTLNTLVQGAWALLLSRYSGESDVVFGATVSGRPPALSGVESMVGLFINTLPVRVQVSPETELLTWLKQLQVKQVEREQYSYSSLVEIQGWSDVERNLPLFNSIVVFENYPVDSSLLEGKGSVEIFNVKGFERTNYPLTVAVFPGRELSIQISYDTTRFDAAAVSRLIGHLQTLLSGIAAHPSGRICELSLLTELEKQQILVEWNDTAKEYPQDKCIHQLFEMAVERSPDSAAVVFEGEQLTYRELNARANQLAHYLRSLGVGPEVLVGICVERSIEMIIGLLSVLKAGGAYVPIDTAYPSERIAYMLDDSHLPVLLTQQKLVASLPEHQARVVCLDADWSEISAARELPPITDVTPENLAYVIYTSGSTGKPKGAKVAHQGLCNLATAQIKLFDVQPNSRILQFASFSFDASIWEIVMALCAGAKLCLGTRESLQPGLPLLRLLQEQGITHITLVPSALAVLPSEELPALLNIIVAGEPCPANLVAQWAKGRRFFNAYGPAESTVCATVAQCFEGKGTPPIGRPIANTRIYILDPNLQPVPVSIPGELHIASVGLARGYLNRPDLTEAKFIPNPFCNEPDSRLYKTGDLARYLPDGNIEFLGRIDNQVKIRGFRIEPGEIEALLSHHPGVRETAVIVRENVADEKQLVAYVVPHHEGTPTISDLRHFLKQKLPNYMIPAAFVMLDNLPLTPNGKVDRRVLPDPELRPELELTFVAPRTPIEEMIASVWAEVLKMEMVGVHDNFFELGGHSLKATQIMSQLQEAFKVELPLRELFAKPTVAELAATIAHTLDSSSTVAANTQRDFNAEAVLDPNIQPQTVSFTYTSKPKSIFLTGASGFLGAYLLYELLEQTQADIYCLLRSANEKQAKQKLQSKLESYQLWKEAFSSRIIPVVGDLSKNLLGLSTPLFQYLASQIDVIYHNGAWVNTVYPYSTLKPANILGTQEVLRLASEIKLKPVHYISTISVFSSPAYAEMKIVSESDPLEYSKDINNGYTESKWVAEKLVMLARDRGLPVCIYRPARILGHSKTGICNPNDLLSKFIPGCVQLGIVPKLDNWAENIIPVDYMSRAIVHLSEQKESLGKAFHLVNPHSTSMNELFNYIRALGYSLEEVSYEEWRSQLFRANQVSPSEVLQSLVPIFAEENMEMTSKLPEFDFTNTRSGLADKDIIFPSIERGLIEKYLSDFTTRGLVPKRTP